ncbi:hypothetical protein [Paenibacillus sp. y28]|uniref:hypothetical protein n=1 Tax=Paenibacillus sp. y28 TaxID=3129110 RepID=UPI00301874F8
MTEQDKKTYYVSVQANTVLDDKGAAAFEFEIEATDEDIEKLEELFEYKIDADDGSALRSHLPAIPYHIDEENDAYDASLREIYRQIHHLGTLETKQHIESMDIL